MSANPVEKQIDVRDVAGLVSNLYDILNNFQVKITPGGQAPGTGQLLLGDNNAILALSLGDSGSGAKTKLPFSIITSNQSGSWKKGVYAGSVLLTDRPTYDPSANLAAVAGIFATDPPSPTDGAWTTMLAGATPASPDVLWLEIGGDPVGGATSYKIKSLGNGDTFTGSTPAIEYSGSPPVQTFARLVIAYGYFISNAPDVGPVWVPRVTTHLIQKVSEESGFDNTNSNGVIIPALVAAAYP